MLLLGVALDLAVSRLEAGLYHIQIVGLSDGQMVSWSDGQVVRWSDGQVVRWSDDQMVRWSDCQTDRESEDSQSAFQIQLEIQINYFQMGWKSKCEWKESKRSGELQDFNKAKIKIH